MTAANIYRILEILPVPTNYAPWSWVPWTVNLGSRSPEGIVPPMIVSRYYATTEFNVMSFGVSCAVIITFDEIEDCRTDMCVVALADCKLEAALASMNDKYGLPRKPSGR